MNIGIETASVTELPAIANLAGRIWRAHYPGIISVEQVEYMLARMFDLTEMERQIAIGILYEQLIADRQLIGFASHGPSSATGEHKLDKLYVLAEFQRHGFGSRLLRHVEESAKASGSNTVILTVNKLNVQAIDAYKKNGFKIRGPIVTEIGNGFVMDDYLMAKLL